MKYVLLIVTALMIVGCDKKIHEAGMPNHGMAPLASAIVR